MTSEERPARRRDLWDDAHPDDRAAETRRSRHHTRRRRRFPWWIALVVVLLVALLCSGGAWTLLGDGAATAACGDPISVAAAPEIAEPLTKALDKVAGECTDYDVSAVAAPAAVRSINEGTAPDVWVPDSSTWLDAVDEDAGPGQWLEGQSIATSPVVLAAGSQTKGAPARISTWTTVVNDAGDLVMANPDVDTASRLAFHASRVGQPSRIGLETGERLIFLSRFAAPSVNKLFGDYASDPGENHPFPASEQAVAQFNAEHPDLAPLRALVPQQGTLSLDYPWITNPQLAGAALEAADRARAQLGTIEVRESLTRAGFRGADGRGGPEIAGRDAPEITELDAPDRSERLALVEQWDIMRTDMRMLAVIDASGSMEWSSTTPGMSRWEVTKGSLLTGVDMLPAGSEVGAWVFSSERRGGTDHQPVAPVVALNEPVGTGTHRDRLRTIVTKGDRYLGGDTGLYDSIWAAHQKMVSEYDPEFVNSIVVFTDGENDDPTGGLSLQQLLTRLDESYDPQRPVRVITIGMGEANPSALQKIADETGGTSYIAETPEDIERVFVEALLARTSG